MSPRSQASLPDDLIDEILLRFPPEEPELLVRAALVCKRWFHLISDPCFRRRFRELHRAAPMLGFFCTDHSTSRFVPTSSAPLPHAIRRDWLAVDARHGRVLLICSGNDLVVWNPVTGEQHRLPKLPDHMYPRPYPLGCTWTAAVLCAVTEGGCDHLDCHRDPFLVVFMCTSTMEAFACVYSSETGVWSGPASAQLRHARVHLGSPSALVGSALHFMSLSNLLGSLSNLEGSEKILKHVLGTKEISLIDFPHKPYNLRVLMTMEDGTLGFAAVLGSKLDVWLMVSSTEGEECARWAQSHTIDLGTIETLPASLSTVCCIYGVAAILRGAKDRSIFVIGLKSRQVRKIPEGCVAYPVIPFTSFYTSALRAASTGKGL